MDICAEEMHNSIHSSVALQGDIQGHPNSDMDRKKIQYLNLDGPTGTL